MADGTISVRLKRDWFAPDGSLYQTRDNPHQFPAYYGDKPKKRKDESDEDFEKRNAASKYEVLPSTAEVVEDAKTVAVLQQTAGGYVEVATAVEGDVKSVGGALDKSGVEQPSQPTAAAEKGAEALNLDAGGNPRESGPLPAGARPRK